MGGLDMIRRDNQIMVEMDEQTKYIADLEKALQSANARIINLTEEMGPWKARALRAEKLIEGGLSIEAISTWLQSKGYRAVKQ
jgi:hypothetical protein